MTMYTPARSDLLALALAVLATSLLLAVLESSTSISLALAAFVAIPAMPLVAAWASGPSHSMTSRFLFRGTSAVAGMASAIVAGATFDDSESASILFGIMWAIPLATFAFLLVLIADTLLRMRAPGVAP